MANASRRADRRRRRSLTPPLGATAMSLVKALISLAQEVVTSGKLSVCQKRNGAAITRRVKLLLMLFEEVWDNGVLLTPSALLSFTKLHFVIQAAKILVEDCRECSRIWLLMEQDRISQQFLELEQEMATALDILPLSLLDVSCEVREQVELVHRQVKKAKLYKDPSEEQLRADTQSVMGELERKETPSVAKLRRVMTSMELNSAKDCEKEVGRLEEEAAEGEWEAGKVSEINGLVSLVRYCKCVLYGGEEEDQQQEDENKEGEEQQSQQECEGEEQQVPEDFRCPISLAIMEDPVIVSTGQTYERTSITRWMESGHDSCPTSGMKLAHRRLIPNYALRNLIRQWCVRHNVHLAATEKPRGGTEVEVPITPAALEATKLTAELLLRRLPEASPELQRQIAAEIRLLAKCATDNRKLIADAGAIPLLLPLISAPDVRTQEHAVTALLNLSIYYPNKSVIVEAGALRPLVAVLHSDTATLAARENAAATLFSLSHANGYATLVGDIPEAIDGLLLLLRRGSVRGQRDAVCALFNIAVCSRFRPTLVNSGVVPALLQLLSVHSHTLIDEALALLALLARCPEGRVALTSSSALPLLAELLGIASPKGKENILQLLLSLCKHEGAEIIRNLPTNYHLVPFLYCSMSNGTPRARRKAASLLRILQQQNSSIAGSSTSFFHSSQQLQTTLSADQY